MAMKIFFYAASLRKIIFDAQSAEKLEPPSTFGVVYIDNVQKLTRKYKLKGKLHGCELKALRRP